MSDSCRNSASVSWTTTGNALLTSVLSPLVYFVVVETIQKWACSNVALGHKISSLTAASGLRVAFSFHFPQKEYCSCFLSTADADVLTPCAVYRDSKYPAPPPGTKWKEVRHDNKVTWLVSWTENIQGSIKYIMLNPSSRIKVM